MNEITVKTVAAGKVGQVRWKSQQEALLTWPPDVLKPPAGQKFQQMTNSQSMKVLSESQHQLRKCSP